MKINRELILEQLFEFSQADHGVVIGKPGIGKSYMLRLLTKKLIERSIVSGLIRIDYIEDASDKAIAEEIGLEGKENWIEELNKVSLKEGQKAVLIFDAFDAARNDKVRKDYFAQIRKAKRELSGKWNIVVSVRSYDASKSPELLKIFSSQNSDYSFCRSFDIPELEQSEINQALDQNEGLKSIYNECTEELRKVLRIPYFLALLETTLTGASVGDITTIKSIKSETQLLATFWDKKIANTDGHLVKEKFLYELTQHFIKTKSLSCYKADIFKLLSTEELKEFDYFRSEDILNEISINNSRIAYSHNIMFDYAVSRLFIVPDYKRVLAFLEEDRARPFFLRPSFVYFFTQLWHQERSQFWSIYWEFQQNLDKQIQLFVRLILNSIIATEYASFEELTPLVEKKNATILHHLLQSIRFAKGAMIEKQDVDLLFWMSNNLEVQILWDFSFLLEKAISTEVQDLDLSKCGIAVRNFFEFILKNKDKNSNIDGLGSTKGVDLLLKTYFTDPVETRKSLEKVLDFLKSSNFNIWYFTSLTEGLGQILKYDIDFVNKVYNILYLHLEDSTEETSMGGNVLMQFKGNRRQDFDMCLYRLGRLFPDFIKKAPNIAIETGLNILNATIEADRLNFSDRLETQTFNIDDLVCKFTPDSSAIWADSFGYKQAGDIARKIIEYFENLIKEDKITELNHLCIKYFTHAECAFTWKIFLELGAKHPAPLLNELFLLATSEPVLESNDTVYEIGEVIGQIAPLLDKKSRIKEIEQAILSIRDSKYRQFGAADIPPEQLLRYKDNSISRLLNKIPKELLQLEESKDFIEKHEKVANAPIYKFSSSFEPVTTEMWMQHEGVDTKKEDNLKLIKQIQILEAFNHTWLNGFPLRDQYFEYLKTIEELFNTIKQDIESIDKKVVFSSLNAVARALAIISRVIESLNKAERNFAKTAIVYCFEYVSEHDKSFDSSSSPATGYSSTPRIDAAEALTHFAATEDQREIIDLVKIAAEDANPVVRFNVIKNIASIKERYRTDYWDLIYSRLEKESDFFTSGQIIHNIIIKDEQPEVVNKALEIANKKEGFFDSNNSFTQSYASLLLLLFNEKNNSYAKGILEDKLKGTLFVRTIVFKVFEFIDPGRNPWHDYSNNTTLNDKLFEYLKQIVEANGEILSKFKVEDFSKENLEIKNALEIIDQVVQRSYFALDINDRIRGRDRFPVNDENRKALYFKLKPILQSIISNSSKITGGGIILAHTAHYFMEILNGVISYDARDILTMANQITKYSVDYRFDSLSIREVVSLTEKLLVDHKNLFLQPDALNELIDLLDIYINSGWPDALELLWKLDDIFK